MAIYLSSFSCEIREVHLSQKPLEMIKLSPKGTVPVLLLPTFASGTLPWPDSVIISEPTPVVIARSEPFTVVVLSYTLEPVTFN